MDYRKLGPDDLDELVQLGLTFVSENSHFRNARIDTERMRFITSALLTDKSGTCAAYGAFDAGEMIGFIVGEVVDDLWSTRKILSDHGFFVRKEYRGEGVGTELMLMFKRFADVWNADLRILISGGIDDDRSVRVMDKLGFQRRGYLVGMEAAQCH